MTVGSAIIDRVLPEIQNVIGKLPLDHNGNGTGTSLNDQGLGNKWKEPNTNFTKDSRSAFDLRKNVNFTLYTGMDVTLQKGNNLFISVPCSKWSNLAP